MILFKKQTGCNINRRLSSKSIWILMLLFFISCQDVKKPEMPANLIPQEKMVGILTELYLNNASRNVNPKLIREMGVQLDSMIYIKYDIDSLQFVLSNAYYSSELDIYRELLTKVQDSLSILQKEKDSIYKEIVKQDSIVNSLKKTQKTDPKN